LAEYSDTHCHLNLNSFQEDLPAVIERARLAGISRILVPGIDLPTSLEAIRLSEQVPEIYAAIGVHPNSALTWNKDTLAELRRLAAHPKVAAIGEIGLDFYRDSAPQALQQEVLALQLELAAELNRPVILHSRESLTSLWETLETWQRQLADAGSPLARRPGILHSYDGDTASAQKAIRSGFLIGISGPVTFKNGLDRQQVVTGLPIQALVVETDAPFLTPHPHRGKRNEPAHVTLVAQKIASLQNRSIEEVLHFTNLNADEIFGWRISA
jgi:TatD DNase family protein